MIRAATFAVPLVALLGGCPVAAMGDQTDARLDGLFAALKTTTEASKGRRITRQIRIIWRQTENEIANNAMTSAGWELYNERYRAALELLNRALVADPAYAEAWSRRAAVYYVLGDYPSAMQDIRRTLALEPRHFGALAELGAIYMRLEDFGSAKRALEKALEINPHLGATRQNLETVERRLNGETA